ncbi:ATP-binding protein [Paenibacillus sp. JTLBN-2024]
MEEGAVIKLAVQCKPDETWVSISDNGAGMSGEIRDSLLHYDEASPKNADGKSGHSTGLGTRNVFKRLELFYDRKDLVRIESAPGAGTTVILRIPVRGKEENHVSPVDRG